MLGALAATSRMYKVGAVPIVQVGLRPEAAFASRARQICIKVHPDRRYRFCGMVDVNRDVKCSTWREVQQMESSGDT